MRELVIVISDFYLAPAGDPDHSAQAGAAESLPGVSCVARFGERSPVEEGWRSWLARWLGREDLAGIAPATVAGCWSVPSAGATASDGATWFATPVHLIAGLTSLHLDRRSILRLPGEEAARLAQDFAKVFGEVQFTLESIDSGIFLMRSRAPIDAHTIDPARAVVSDLKAALPTGPDAPVLRRLGAELEMWLHGHPINQRRAQRGELPVSTLWLWGGGRGTQPAHLDRPRTHDVGFGSDAYFVGLWRAQGLQPLSLPDCLPSMSSDPHARRVALILETTPLLEANPSWTVLQALADLDRRFITPALETLRAAEVASVMLIANDVKFEIKRRDRLRFWRRRFDSALGALRSG